MSQSHPGASQSEEPETVARQFLRLRRAVVAGHADADTAFLTRVADEFSLLVARAVGYLEEIAKRTDRPNDAERAGLARFARDAARWLTLQSGHHGIWFGCDGEPPTRDPDSEVSVLFCTDRNRLPVHGRYVTDDTGRGTWEIYSGLQDYFLEYKGDPPSLWCFAPDKPDLATLADRPDPADQPLRYDGDRFARALREDLASTGLAVEAEAILALPSLHRMLRETDQIRAAYLRTAEALGVPANAQAPAERARQLATAAGREGPDPK